MTPVITPDYTVYFNENCLEYLSDTLLPERYSKLFIITDTNTGQYCLPLFLEQLATEITIEIIEIEAGESNKTIDTCVQVWHALAELGADRKSLIINLGGGVVTDLGGFVASTFKRGIDFINVPTSLLAMVDASIGGKTGVDLGSLKNQVGVINNPKAVLIDILFLQTLPPNEIRSGFAEMFKHGLICDKEYWNDVVDLANLIEGDLGHVIKKSVEIKNTIVKQDPKELNIRKALNFGHTLGHAIESYFLESKDKPNLLHGEAIAAGMILEAYISYNKGLLPERDYNDIKVLLLSVYGRLNFTSFDVNEIVKLLVHDKKNEFGSVLFVLLNGIGKNIINQQAENALIFKAFEDYAN